MGVRTIRHEFQIAASATWTPASVSGLRLWLDPSDAASITQSGGLVSQINDKSGNGFHMVQATGPAQPTTGTRTINGLNVLDFDGATDEMNATGSTVANTIMGASSAGTVLYVMALDADPSAGAGAVLSDWGSDAASPNDHEPFVDSHIYHGWGSTTRKDTGDPTPALTTPRMVTITTAAGAWSYTIDAAAHYSTGTNTVGWETVTAAKFGYTTSADFHFDGRIAELIAYDTALSGADLTNAQSYLRTKWGTA